MGGGSNSVLDMKPPEDVSPPGDEAWPVLDTSPPSQGRRAAFCSGYSVPGTATGGITPGRYGSDFESIDVSRPTSRNRNAGCTDRPRSGAKHRADGERSRSVPDQTSSRRNEDPLSLTRIACRALSTTHAHATQLLKTTS